MLMPADSSTWNNFKGLQEALGMSYKMADKVACLDMLRNLDDFKETFDRVAMAGQ
jgi:hypothetical protein